MSDNKIKNEFNRLNIIDKRNFILLLKNIFHLQYYHKDIKLLNKNCNDNSYNMITNYNGNYNIDKKEYDYIYYDGFNINNFFNNNYELYLELLELVNRTNRIINLDNELNKILITNDSKNLFIKHMNILILFNKIRDKLKNKNKTYFNNGQLFHRIDRIMLNNYGNTMTSLLNLSDIYNKDDNQILTYFTYQYRYDIFLNIYNHMDDQKYNDVYNIFNNL